MNAPMEDPTNVRSGSGKALVLQTGSSTVFGGIAGKLRLRAPETDFDRGLRQFGQLLLQLMVVMVLAVLVINGVLGRPVFESILFAIALAVGLAPEMLPAVLAVNLAKSAQTMAGLGVLVRRLTAIENLGSMDVLCTDKTGTLTEGEIRLDGSWDPDGRPSPAVLRPSMRRSRPGSTTRSTRRLRRRARSTRRSCRSGESFPTTSPASGCR